MFETIAVILLILVLASLYAIAECIDRNATKKEKAIAEFDNHFNTIIKD